MRRRAGSDASAGGVVETNEPPSRFEKKRTFAQTTATRRAPFLFETPAWHGIKTRVDMRVSLRARARAWRGAVETLKGASHAALEGSGMDSTEIPRSNGFAPRCASDPESLRRTRRSPEGLPSTVLYWFGLFSRFMTHHRGSERFCHTAKKIISHVGLSDEYEHPRAESAPPCGARPCTNPFFAPSRAILVTMAIETVRARLSREPEPRVPRAFSAAHPVFSSASHPGGSVPTRAGQRARTRGERRARGAPRRGLRARRRVLRRDRTNPAADSLARPTFPSPPRSIPPRRHRHIVSHLR